MAHGVPSRELGGPSGKRCSLQTRLRTLGPEHDGGGHRSRGDGASRASSCDPRGAVPACCRGCHLPPYAGQVAGGTSGMQDSLCPRCPTARGAHSLSCSPSREPGGQRAAALITEAQAGWEGAELVLKAEYRTQPSSSGGIKHFPPPAPGASLGGADPPGMCVHAHIRLINDKLLQSNIY